MYRSAGAAARAETGRDARPRHPLLPGDLDLWPRHGEAPKPRPVELRTVVAEAAEAVCPSGGSGVEIVNNVTDGFVLWADPEHIVPVLMNLLRNGDRGARKRRSGAAASRRKS